MSPMQKSTAGLHVRSMTFWLSHRRSHSAPSPAPTAQDHVEPTPWKTQTRTPPYNMAEDYRWWFTRLRHCIGWGRSSRSWLIMLAEICRPMRWTVQQDLSLSKSISHDHTCLLDLSPEHKISSNMINDNGHAECKCTTSAIVDGKGNR